MIPLPPRSTLFPYTTLFRSVTLFAMELIPRITRAQSMDVLSSMATIAGYKAVLLAADRLPKMFPRSEEHTSELQSRRDLVCRLLLEKKKKNQVLTLSTQLQG